jgi:lipid II:glycine glycyltransferase (peptidoglycan interpeptide bridge formation enzyme)
MRAVAGVSSSSLYFVALDWIEASEIDRALEKLDASDVRVPLSTFRVRGRPRGFGESGLCHAILDLDGAPTPETVLARMQPRKRTQVRQALRHEHQVEWLPLESADADELYAVYRSNMIRHGTIPRSKATLFEFMAGTVELVRIRYPPDAWGAMNVILRTGPYAMVLLSFSEPRYWSLHVNEILYFESIRGAIHRGIQWLDLGSTGTVDEPLRRFKRHLGGEEHAIGVYRRASARTLRRERWKGLLHRARTLGFQAHHQGIGTVARGFAKRVARRWQ